MITGILIGIGCLAVGGIALLILIFTSIKTLEVNEVGLDYSGITKTIDSDILGYGKSAVYIKVENDNDVN